MRFLQRFYVVWGIVLALVVWSQVRAHTDEVSVEEINTAAENILSNLQYPFLLFAVLFCYRSLRKRSRKASKSATPAAPVGRERQSVKLAHVPKRLGRVTRCYQCKRQIVEHTGATCHFCHWIRCRCGACGCGFGKMA